MNFLKTKTIAVIIATAFTGLQSLAADKAVTTCQDSGQTRISTSSNEIPDKNVVEELNNRLSSIQSIELHDFKFKLTEVFDKDSTDEKISFIKPKARLFLYLKPTGDKEISEVKTKDVVQSISAFARVKNQETGKQDLGPKLVKTAELDNGFMLATSNVFEGDSVNSNLLILESYGGNGSISGREIKLIVSTSGHSMETSLSCEGDKFTD